MTSKSLSGIFNRPLTTTFRFKYRSDEINNKIQKKRHLMQLFTTRSNFKVDVHLIGVET